MKLMWCQHLFYVFYAYLVYNRSTMFTELTLFHLIDVEIVKTIHKWRDSKMIRASVAGVIGFILIFIESMIVMKIKGLVTIEFGGIVPFINVWAMNFFFVFAILTQATNWYRDKESLKEDNSF
jgi:hypothetical protein